MPWLFPTDRELRLYAEDTAAEVAESRMDSAWRLMWRKRVYSDGLVDAISRRRIDSDSPLEVLSAERDVLEWMNVSSGIVASYANRPL